MNQSRPMELTAYSQARHLSLNLITATRVAGPQRADGSAGRLSSVVIQQKTGIARTTLRALKNTSQESGPNPDLRTLCRLADQLGIPVAFLLMRPSDWNALRLAVDGISDPLQAAYRLTETGTLGGPELAEKVLKACDVHPERPPLSASPDTLEQSRLEARNEWRRRSCHVLAALAQPAARDRKAHMMLTALAASLANQTTPNDPQGA